MSAVAKHCLQCGTALALLSAQEDGGQGGRPHAAIP